MNLFIVIIVCSCLKYINAFRSQRTGATTDCTDFERAQVFVASCIRGPTTIYCHTIPKPLSLFEPLPSTWHFPADALRETRDVFHLDQTRFAFVSAGSVTTISSRAWNHGRNTLEPVGFSNGTCARNSYSEGMWGGGLWYDASATCEIPRRHADVVRVQRRNFRRRFTTVYIISHINSREKIHAERSKATRNAPRFTELPTMIYHDNT